MKKSEGILPARTGRHPFRFGPVFVRELVSASRARLTFEIRVVWVAIFFVLSAVRARELMSPEPPRSPAPPLHLRELDSMVAYLLGWHFALTVIYAVGLFSFAVSSEISKRRLGLLMSTPVSAWEFAFNKFAANGLNLLSLSALAFIPIFYVSRLGFVPLRRVIAVFVVTWITVIVIGPVVMTVSLLARSTSQALTRSGFAVLLLFLLWILFPGAIFVVLGPKTSGRFFLSFSPCYVTAQTISAVNDRHPIADVSWTACCLAGLLTSALVFLYCARCVRVVGLCQATGDTRAFLWRRARKKRKNRRRVYRRQTVK